jgi:hypothetical protein
MMSRTDVSAEPGFRFVALSLAAVAAIWLAALVWTFQTHPERVGVTDPKQLHQRNVVVSLPFAPKVGDSVKVSLQKVSPAVLATFRYRLQYIKEGGAWAPISPIQPTMPEFKFHEPGVVGLHLDVFNEKNELVKAFYLNTWRVEP